MVAPQAHLSPSPVLLCSLSSTFLPNFCYFWYFPPAFSFPANNKWSAWDFKSYCHAKDTWTTVINPNQLHHFFWKRAILSKLQLQSSFQRNSYSSWDPSASPHAAALFSLVQDISPHNRVQQRAAWHRITSSFPWPARDKTPDVLCFTHTKVSNSALEPSCAGTN